MDVNGSFGPVGDINKIIESFHCNISSGPEYLCLCCEQIWYKTSLKKFNVDNYKSCDQNILSKCNLVDVKIMHGKHWICFTCNSHLRSGKVSPYSKANKMEFPDKPACLNLTSLEERLISPRIPFMQIRELPRGGQLSIHGGVVNVPADVGSTVNTLPRPLNDSQTIPIKLKRRLSYKHHYQFQHVRPHRVLEAIRYLVQTSDLF